ncbi:DUF6474 family protein [Corynebacterium callunae]|uniref:Uncharacterized protein n=1 Tax=Corynebacterium callunae DSM 20147 TaxID=1121353 RepID=M1V0P4_9CORY|nr:DUF6474 family protein [Corynebacterium callunae]AGG67898.1 hypothetical protein H924_12385 [Corynebacterium callunae DSM 20147]
MGIFEKVRAARAKTKAEIKAAELKVKTEAKNKAKLDLKREKLLVQAEKNLLKAEEKGLKKRNKHELKMAKNILEQKRQGRLNKDKVKRWTGTARLLAPLLLPVFYRVSTEARNQIVKTKASRAGVTPEQLAQFAGHSAALKARIQGVRENAESAALPHGFIQDVKERLDELEAAAENSEFMSPQQRNRAHQSINRDLAQVSDQIQDRLLDK